MLVSFIIPVYNCEMYIRDCVLSILQNALDYDFEIIIINDGSQDNTLNICEELKSKHDCIKLINQKNKGISAARNIGLLNSVGKWICFVDADDIILPTSITDLLDDNNSDIIVLTKNVKQADTEGNVSKLELINATLKLSIDDLYSDYYFTAVWSKMYRRAFLEENNLSFDTELICGEDMFFNINAYYLADHVSIYKRSFYCYKVHMNSTVRKFQKNIISADIKFQVKLRNWLIRHNYESLENYDQIVLNGLWNCMVQNIFHYQNVIPFKERLLILKNIIRQQPYNNSIKRIRYTKLSSQKKVLLYLLRVHCYFPLYLVLKRISSKNSRSQNIEKDIYI